MSIVVRASTKASGGLDPTVYPVEEEVGEDLLQRFIAELLRPLIARWLRQQGVRALVGADQFIYYRPYTPTLRVAPDIYVLPGVRPESPIASWKIWEEGGVVPSFVLEIASKDWEKDYVEAPEKYAAIGVPEVVIFDPTPRLRPEGFAWQVFRRVAGRPLRRVEVSQGDRVKSKALGCYLRSVGSGDALRLRLGIGARGDHLFPTTEEAERADKEVERAAKEAERAAKEAERAAKEAERAAKEAERAAKEGAIAAWDGERAAKEAAQKRVLELEAKLRRRRRGSR
jgi:Uma2 family endonuclease